MNALFEKVKGTLNAERPAAWIIYRKFLTTPDPSPKDAEDVLKAAKTLGKTPDDMDADVKLLQDAHWAQAEVKRLAALRPTQERKKALADIDAHTEEFRQYFENAKEKEKQLRAHLVEVASQETEEVSRRRQLDQLKSVNPDLLADITVPEPEPGVVARGHF